MSAPAAAKLPQELIAGGLEAASASIECVVGRAALFSTPCFEGEANQDGALFIERDGRVVLAVADGVGGLPGGASASASALRALADAIEKGAAVEDAFEDANEAVRTLAGPATTLVVAELVKVDGRVRLRTYNAGDSQAAIIGGRGKLKGITMPHSIVGHAQEADMLTAEDVATHPLRHLVTNVLGDATLRLDRTTWPLLAKRDTVLLASDGLWDNVSEEEIVSIARQGSVDEALDELARRARAAMESGEEGTKLDDLTIVLWRR